MKSAHSCRVCGRWLEGEWNATDSNHPAGATLRTALQVLMARGYCDKPECAAVGDFHAARMDVLSTPHPADAWTWTPIEGGDPPDIRERQYLGMTAIAREDTGESQRSMLTHDVLCTVADVGGVLVGHVVHLHPGIHPVHIFTGVLSADVMDRAARAADPDIAAGAAAIEKLANSDWNAYGKPSPADFVRAVAGAVGHLTIDPHEIADAMGEYEDSGPADLARAIIHTITTGHPGEPL